MRVGSEHNEKSGYITRATRLASALFSFELTYLLFLFAGLFKGDPRFARVPIDLTLLFLAINVLSAVVIVCRRTYRPARPALVLISLYGVFASWAAISILWSPSTDYAPTKAARVGVLAFWALIAPALIVAPDQGRAKRLLSIFLLFSGWVGLETLVAFARNPAGQFVYVLGGRYLGPARLFSYVLIVLTAVALISTCSRKLRTGAMIGAIVTAGLMLVVGARGPLLSAGGTLLIPAALGVRWSRSAIVKARGYAVRVGLFALTGVAAVTAMILSGEVTATLSRLMLLLNGELGASASKRVWYLGIARDIWLQHPIAGAGLSGWPVLAGEGDVRGYPHNLVMEILSELGVVGLALFVTVAVYALYRLGPWKMVRRSPWRLALVMLIANAFLNAMVSGDLHDNRILFTLFGLCLSATPGIAETGDSHDIRLGAPQGPLASISANA